MMVRKPPTKTCQFNNSNCLAFTHKVLMCRSAVGDESMKIDKSEVGISMCM